MPSEVNKAMRAAMQDQVTLFRRSEFKAAKDRGVALLCPLRGTLMTPDQVDHRPADDGICPAVVQLAAVPSAAGAPQAAVTRGPRPTPAKRRGSCRLDGMGDEKPSNGSDACHSFL